MFTNLIHTLFIGSDYLTLQYRQIRSTVTVLYRQIRSTVTVPQSVKKTTQVVIQGHVGLENWDFDWKKRKQAGTELCLAQSKLIQNWSSCMTDWGSVTVLLI